MKEIYKQAEANYLYEEYDLANQLYILLEDPENLKKSYLGKVQNPFSEDNEDALDGFEGGWLENISMILPLPSNYHIS